MENNNSANKNPIENKNKFTLATIDFLIAIIFFLPFAVTFGIFTANENYYLPCFKESSSYWWSKFSMIFFIIGFISLGLISPFLICIYKKFEESKKKRIVYLENIVVLVKIVLSIVSLVNFGGICYAYGEEENCGSLNNLLLGFIIVYSIILGTIVLYLCVITSLTLCLMRDIYVTVKNKLNRPLMN